MGMRMGHDMTFFFELKNFKVSAITLTYNQKPNEFSFDNNHFTEKFNTNFKAFIKEYVTEFGMKGFIPDPEILFGDKYASFWSSFFETATLSIKHQYMQINVERQYFEDFTLFHEAMYLLFRSWNNTEPFSYHQSTPLTMNLLHALGSTTDSKEAKMIFPKTKK